MLFKKLADIIYIKGTASEDTHITVKLHGTGAILWSGPAKFLKKYTKKHAGWIVVEVLIDKDDPSNCPDYNKGKIITVI